MYCIFIITVFYCIQGAQHCPWTVYRLGLKLFIEMFTRSLGLHFPLITSVYRYFIE